MTILNAIYTVLLGPLELFFDVVYTLSYKIVKNPGLAIVFLSLVMNFLVLPLYKKADEMQAEERAIQAKLQPGIKHIKKTFKGDEQYMILRTFYRQNNYKPTDALKGSVSLLLEIPFFIAAYRFLSGLKLLDGVSFGLIDDLGAPDTLLVISGVTIHLLPILMTVINLVSSAIYSKGLTLKSKIQMYGVAIIFLVLLYESPSGLVFYWTLNNVFSLVKNIFYKLKNPKLVLYILMSLVSAGLLIYVIFINPFESVFKQNWIVSLLSLLQLPIISYFASKKIKIKKQLPISNESKSIFYIGCIFVTVLMGVLIPSAVIESSPAEFVDVTLFKSPLWYILNSLLISFGTFMIWSSVFYMLAGERAKQWFSIGIWCFSGVAITNYMFFGRDLGILSNMLQFDKLPMFTVKQQLINVLVIVAVTLILFFIYYKKASFVRLLYIAATFAVVVMSIMNVNDIYKQNTDVEKSIKIVSQKVASIPLSRNGKNVVIIMLDRAISHYVPFIFNEKPELAEQFSGFTYYPNTLSYGISTNFAIPALFGGYEYTPENLNARKGESLESKHNEALKVMPVLFAKNGFNVTVCDPPYAGYKWIPDLSIFDDCEGVSVYNTEGKYNEAFDMIFIDNEEVLKRNFFCYSVLKVSPLFVQPIIYSNGQYNNADAITQLSGKLRMKEDNSEIVTPQVVEGTTKATGIRQSFLNSYGVLMSLSRMTDLQDNAKNNFFILSNSAPHEPMLLQMPNYTVEASVDNSAYTNIRTTADGRMTELSSEKIVTHYHANMASFIQLGKWLNFLKEKGAYDNTRIIIVSDHGADILFFGNHKYKDLELNIAYLNPLLLVKDFDSNSAFQTDLTFMTNADVPTIASSGIIKNVTNPFTGEKINSNEKNVPVQKVFYSRKWQVTENNGDKFLPGHWYTVSAPVYELDNWSYVETK
ncbi:MAG: membrane protein insertase YidC [Ruminococcaceae bacterium]|nr:membrane protein insertase YidC [Oscillospiraceae bacterium]